MENLEKYKKIKLCDYSGYDPDKCNNGGCYGFWTTYDYIGNDRWEVSYGTTADFDFCPVCGSFNNHYDGDNEEYCCGDFEVVSTHQIENIITEFKKKHVDDEDYFIEFK